MKKQIEILSLLLGAGVLVVLACLALVGWMSNVAFGAGATAAFLLHFGAAFWLFRQPDPKSSTAGVWAMLGSLAGLMAVALYFLAEINSKMTTLLEKTDSATT